MSLSTKEQVIYILKNIIQTFRHNKLAKKLLIVVIMKFLLFFGVLKGFIYPEFLKPKHESTEHRVESVTNQLINFKK